MVDGVTTTDSNHCTPEKRPSKGWLLAVQDIYPGIAIVKHQGSISDLLMPKLPSIPLGDDGSGPFSWN